MPTKAATAYQQLRRAILSGRLQPGSRLRLRELAKQLRVSHIPVREALLMLERDGLVRVSPRLGAHVAQMTPSEVAEAYFVRSHLEALATEAAAEHLTESDFDKLARLLREGTAAHDKGDGVRYAASNKEFHSTIYARCPYKLLTRLIFQIWDSGTKFQVLFHLRPTQMAISLQEHRRIVDLLVAGNAKKAGELMLQHRLSTGAALMEYLMIESGSAVG